MAQVRAKSTSGFDEGARGMEKVEQHGAPADLMSSGSGTKIIIEISCR